jgi:hypothetical protein
MNNKKQIIDKIMTDNIKFHPSGKLNKMDMHNSIRIIIVSLMKKYSFVFESEEIARDEVIASLYEALFEISDMMDIDLNNDSFKALLYTITNHNVIHHMFPPKRETIPELHIESLKEYETIEDIKDSSYDICDNHSEYSIWLENHKDVILTEKSLMYLYNRNGGTSTRYSEGEEPAIKNRILKALGNKDPKKENIKYKIKQIERILESNNFITDLKASQGTIDITDVSVDTRRSFNKNNTLTNQQLKELRIFLFKQLNKLNQQLDDGDRFNTPDIRDEYRKVANYRKDTEPFICLNDGKEYIDKAEFAKEHNLLYKSVRDVILKSKKSDRPYQVKGYFLITKSRYDPNKDYSEFMKSKPVIIRKIICVTTGEVFNTLGESGRKYQVSASHIGQCCRGERKSAGKHPVTGEKMIWMYLEDYNKTT